MKRLIISLKFPKKQPNDGLIKLQTSPQSYLVSEKFRNSAAGECWLQFYFGQNFRTELCPVGGVLEEPLLGQYEEGEIVAPSIASPTTAKSLLGVRGGIEPVPERVFSQGMIPSNKKTPWGTGYTNRTQISYLNIKTKSCMRAKICK